jgi:hypothetical protein
VIVAQSRARFSHPAMIKLPRTFVTTVGLLCSSIHCAANPANSLNASLHPPVIKNDFAVGEYSPKYCIKTASL